MLLGAAPPTAEFCAAMLGMRQPDRQRVLALMKLRPHRVRKIVVATQVVTTVAGTGIKGFKDGKRGKRTGRAPPPASTSPGS